MATGRERQEGQSFRGTTGDRERSIQTRLWQSRNACAVPGIFPGAASHVPCGAHQFDEPVVPGGQSGNPGLPFLSLGGSAVGSLLNPTLTADHGTYSLTGQAADLDADRRTTGGQGTYTLTGQAAGLRTGRRTAGGQGTYSLTGQAAALRAARRAIAEQGAYALTGQNAGLRAARRAAAGQGTYSLTGQDATLTKSGAAPRTLAADHGTYALTGQTAGLVQNRRLVSERGTYALSGQDAGFAYNPADRVLPADVGVYTLSGQSATLRAPQASQAVGGWDEMLYRWDAIRAARRRADDSENPEQAPSADGAPKKPSTPARNAAAPVSASSDLTNLRELVARYGREAQAQIDNERVAAALGRAVANPTSGALLALDKELARMREEEEFVVLMVLALDD